MALFPDSDRDKKGGTINGYAYIGRYLEAHKSLLDSKESTPSQYKKMKLELELIGYNIEILNKKED